MSALVNTYAFGCRLLFSIIYFAHICFVAMSFSINAAMFAGIHRITEFKKKPTGKQKNLKKNGHKTVVKKGGYYHILNLTTSIHLSLIQVVQGPPGAILWGYILAGVKAEHLPMVA